MCQDSIAFELVIMIATLLLFCNGLGEAAQNGGSNSSPVQIVSTEFQTKCIAESCSNVICESITEDEFSLVDHLKVLEQGLCDGVALTVQKTEFRGSILPANWLSTLKRKIGTLTIQDCSITGISANAFNNPTFVSTTITTITNSDIQVIKKNMFSGLTSVTSLAIRSYIHRFELEVEEEGLEGLSSLAILEIKSYTFSTDSIINLTGLKGSYLSKLLLLDLGHNTIEELAENALHKVPHVQRVFLHNSAIKHIDQKAFYGSIDITSLQLANNSLETLTNGTFTKLTKLLDSGLYLSGNNWDCKCSLQWLKDFYLHFDIINKTTPLMCTQGLPFEKVEFCLESTEIVTVTDVDTTPHVSSSSTGQPPGASSSTDHGQTQITTFGSLQESYTTIECVAQGQKSNVSLGEEANYVGSMELRIKNEAAVLDFEEFDGDEFWLKVVINNIVLKPEDRYSLLWFNTNNKSDCDCIWVSNNTVYIHSLHHGTTYTFSLLHANETEISPKSTFGLTTQPEWKQKAWLLNKSKVAVLALTGFCIVFVSFLTAFFTFICVSRHRKVTNKPVTVQGICGSCGDDAAPRDYEKPAYWEPYVTPLSHGYLTPKHNKYDKIQYPPSLSRSVSEWSLRTPSTMYDHVNYRDRWNNSQISVQKKENYKNFKLSRFNDFRPPLPPRNSDECKF